MAIITVDFDGTLYQGNSFKAMFSVGKETFTAKQWAIVAAGLAKASVGGLLKGKNKFRHDFFRAFAKTFKGKTTEELDLFFQELVDHGKEEVHHTLVSRIHDHQSNGDTVIVLSGALQPFLNAFIKHLQLKDVHVLSTELQFDQDGQCTGEIGQIVNGDVKVAKLQEWMNQQHPTENPPKEVWAYADSESDIPLLHFVSNPVLVNPKQGMLKVAEENKWAIFA
ncbi:HAD family hydrolase [Rossellomorea vietnamensis]|uniref:Haloacid dehalogenase-like hydrolase n=1 Tax=Rossellomorea aquimaris TaxID=189382 RepID=A0A5D4TGZ5_9BACI|nr:HAD family hydrolase [Rossellomorea aquimaris]TYS75083.1 haloacid dehalogenase-like hydrolase [Rossellomorea aquimaris]